MGVIWSFVRRSLAQNKTRTAVSIIGVVLSTALMMAVFTTVTSLQATVIQSVIEAEGAWHAFDSDAEDGWEDAVMAEGRITSVITSGDAFATYLDTEETIENGGSERGLLAVRTLPRIVKGSEEDARTLTEQPTLRVGHLPENENELIVPASMLGLHASGKDGTASWDGELGLGSTVTLEAGQRVTPSGKAISSYYFLSEYFTDEDWEALGDAYMEETVGLISGERELTVVGAYEDQDANIFEAGGSNAGLVAFTSADASSSKDAVWLSTEGFLTREEFQTTLDEIFGEDDYYVHGSVLNYSGLTSSSAIWDSVWAIVAVLAATIMVAAVSLIYNSFAISVAERTRQFGLLSSLGASRKQLGWSVLLEALAIGVVGIPVGIALGIGGVAATLYVSAEALSPLLGAYGSATSAVHVSAGATLIVIGLSLVTLLISALVPALRAGRVSATDAIRQTRDVHLDRATERKLRRADEQGKLLLGASGLRERLGGIGGLLAHRNLRRSGSKGRVVVASLAVSVLLLVTSGAIAEALGAITDRYGTAYGADSSDIVVNLYGSGSGFEVGYDEATRDLAAKLEQVDGLDRVMTMVWGSANATLSEGMCSDEMVASGIMHGEAGAKGGIYDDGSYIDYGYVLLVDDASWQAMLKTAGVDAASQDGGLTALAINRYVSYDDEGRYFELTPFDECGQATLYDIDSDSLGFKNTDDGTYLVMLKGDDGQLMVGLMDYPNGEPELKESTALEDVTYDSMPIQVIGLVDDVPGDLSDTGSVGSFPTLVMPFSQYDAAAKILSFGYARLTYDIEDGTDMEALAAAIDEACAEPPEGTYVIWQNMKENLETTRRVFDMVYLFIFLFSLITMLIAVANVFNTLSNNIILRTREFAVLKSCGMDNRAFGRMLLSECASYAVRGLVIGLALATLAAWAIWQGMAASFAERPFTLPWAYVGAAVTGVVVVLAISVAYALRRSHALNVVEALRADAI